MQGIGRVQKLRSSARGTQRRGNLTSNQTRLSQTRADDTASALPDEIDCDRKPDREMIGESAQSLQLQKQDRTSRLKSIVHLTPIAPVDRILGSG